MRPALLIAIVAATLLIAVTTYRLDRAGVYYDELHQATGAFAYVGRPTPMFSFVRIAGVPLLNMSYTGAIKTALYGLYLRASGGRFSIVSWRLLGILFSATGVIVFCLLVGDRVPPTALVLFTALLLSDTNFLLQTKHDWGPAALGFLLRMIFLGAAIRYLTSRASAAGPFLLGLIVGVAIFEKLSATVLLGPLAVVLLADPRSRSIAGFARATAGVALGASPAIAVNLYSLISSSQLLALTAVDPTPRRSIVGYVANYLALGNGGIERRMIFEISTPAVTEAIEGLAIAALLLFAIAPLLLASRRNRDGRLPLAAVAGLCYGAVGVALPFLPHGTGEHHWIIGTPFQYLAIALAATSFRSAVSPSRGGRLVFATCLIVLFAARVPALAGSMTALRDDRYTRTWDPSLNAAAEFAANQPDSAIFIAANWGVGAQAFCFSNGRQNFVFELYDNYGGPRETLNPLLAPPERQIVVAAALRRPPARPDEINTLRQVTDAIFRDLAVAPGWEEVPLDPAIAGLRAVEIRVFRRVPPNRGL